MRLLVALFSVGSCLCAQQPTISAVAVSPLNCTAATSSTNSSQSVPAGPLAAMGTVGASLSVAPLSTGMQWQTWNASTLLGFWVLHSSSIGATAPTASTVAGDYDLRLNITPPGAGAVKLEVAMVATGTPGVPLPNVQIDIGDDGSAEFTQASPGPLQSVIPVGPGSQVIRVRFQSQLAVQGNLSVDLQVIARPAFMAIDPAIGSCMMGPSRLTVEPTFDGIQVTSPWASQTMPVALVFGMWPQPLIVPSPVTVPCLLLPRPDFVAIVWNQTAYPLSIPTAMWPTLLWTQGVEVWFNGLITTDGYRVTAG